MSVKVLVLMGGPDAERDVSIVSGRAVAEALRAHGRFDVVEHVVDRPDAAALAALATPGEHVVFPVLHGHWGEGGGIQAELETAGLPYVGARPRAARLAMDKLATKMLLSGVGVASPPARELRPGVPCDLEPPLVLKPVDDGSSVDLFVCRTPEEVRAARRVLELKRPRIMAERCIEGREITVGIVHDRVLPLIEITPADGLYDYDAKYDRDDTGYVLDPPLPDAIARTCREASVLAYRRLGCRDLARVDFMVDDETAWFLEINTMPGFTGHSLLPMAAAHAGIPMPALCGGLVEAAITRGKPAVSA